MSIIGKFQNEHLICTPLEQLYLFSGSTQINAQTGCQGHLRGDFDHGGETFFTRFFPAKTPYDDGFSDALQVVVDCLRNEGMLQSFRTMRSWCYSDGWDGKIDARYRSSRSEFGFRVDHKGFAFLFRFIPELGDYHVYCYCYKAEWLDQHMSMAENGIRFIDSNYQEKFRIEDGGRIAVTAPGGKRNEYTCRYVDAYHVEIGSNLFHICEYAELREAAGDQVEPVTGKMVKP